MCGRRLGRVEGWRGLFRGLVDLDESHQLSGSNEFIHLR